MLDETDFDARWASTDKLSDMLHSGVTEIVGSTGSGKSEICRILASAALAEDRRVFAVTDDPRATWYLRAEVIAARGGKWRAEVERVAGLEEAPDRERAIGLCCDFLSRAEEGDVCLFDMYFGADGQRCVAEHAARSSASYVVLCGQEPSPLVGEHDLLLLKTVPAVTAQLWDRFSGGAADTALCLDMGEGMLSRAATHDLLSIEWREPPNVDEVVWHGPRQ